MELMQNVADYGDAPSFIATGVRRIFFISPSIVRVTFARTDMRDDGKVEQRVSGHVDWDIARLRIANVLIRDALAALTPPEAVLPARYLVSAH